MAEYLGKIVKITEETPDVKIFRLELGSYLKFVPGQYCIVSIVGKAGLENEARPFTFSGSPLDAGFAELTVKKVCWFTGEMFKLKVNDSLKIDGPYGEALNFDETVKEDAVFIAGGSGITPFICAIRYAMQKKLKNKIVLLYSCRTAGDIINKVEFDNISSKKIKIVYALSQDAPPGWIGETGRISREMIEKYVSLPAKKLWYICGPPKMVASLKETILGMGVRENMLRFELWELPAQSDRTECKIS